MQTLRSVPVNKKMENSSNRQQKIAKQIQKDMAEILQQQMPEVALGSLVTVTAVRISPDFGYAKIYVSIFPFARHEQVMQSLEQHLRPLRGLLGNRLRNQLKSIPEIQFFLDDSLEYIEHIEQAMKN